MPKSDVDAGCDWEVPKSEVAAGCVVAGGCDIDANSEGCVVADVAAAGVALKRDFVFVPRPPKMDGPNGAADANRLVDWVPLDLLISPNRDMAPAVARSEEVHWRLELLA